MANRRVSNDGFNEDTRLALLEHAIVEINKTMERFEKRFDRIDEKFDKIDERFQKLEGKVDDKFEKVNGKMDAHYRTTIYMILGLYGTVVATLMTAVGKAYHWF